jgi:hypothetical protein
MKLDLRPGEYVVWKRRGSYKATKFWHLAIISLVVFPLTIIILIITLPTFILFGDKYVVTNMRAVVLGMRGVKGEVALNTPGLTVSFILKDIKDIELNHERLESIFYNVEFVVNGAKQLGFNNLRNWLQGLQPWVLT